ncbi:hypothetical protein WA158_007809 [Blastocystis sp. Blastoise]
MQGHIDQQAMEKMRKEAVHYAMSHGVLHGNVFNHKVYYTNMPFALLPVPMSKQLYEDSLMYSRLFDRLVINMCDEREWMLKVLKNCSDPFVNSLLEIADKAYKSFYYQPITLGLLRSDYMINEDSQHQQQLLQIELNTVSCSFPGVMEGISNLQKEVLKNNIDLYPSVQQYYKLTHTEDISSHLPANNTLQISAQGIVEAFHLYKPTTTNPVVMFCVQKSETNGVDQYNLSSYIQEHYHVPCVYKTVDELLTDMYIKEGTLYIYDDNTHTRSQEVALVYFRSCYNPDDLNTPELLRVREDIEVSRAIKCPNVFLQLTGMKCIQQALTEPGTVERFLPSKEAAQLRSCFAGIWNPLSTDIDTKRAVKDAIEYPDDYVLKPQREGGGNLIWGKNIPAVLKGEMGVEGGLGGLILMQRIKAAEYPAIHVVEGEASEHQSIHEFGVYSYVIGGSYYKDNIVGHLFKTKSSESMEGGVCAGFAVLNTAYLQNV